MNSKPKAAYKLRKGPDGFHLFFRKTGTNILFDEVIPPPAQWTNSPRHVSIALTNLCNLQCPHCYATKKKASLSTEQVKKWMRELDQLGTFGIGFGGGEPTLHPDLVELCGYGQDETGLSISLTTNGQNLQEGLIEALTGKLNFMRISMDGVDSTYESIRGRSFKQLIEKIRLVEGRIPFGINYVVNQKTIPDLKKGIDIASDLGAKEFLLLPEIPFGKGTAVDQGTLKKMTDIIMETEKKLQISISSSHDHIFDKTIGLQKEKPLQAFCHIDANGILKARSFDDAGVDISNIPFEDGYNKLKRGVKQQ